MRIRIRHGSCYSSQDGAAFLYVGPHYLSTSLSSSLPGDMGFVINNNDEDKQSVVPILQGLSKES
jgi:hypothetical protein